MMIDGDEFTLVDFGYTQTEALLYYQLLKTSPASGYRLAKSLGRAPPNVYQSLQGLVDKGAVLPVDGANAGASYVPVAPALLLEAFDQEHKHRQARALAALNKVRQPSGHVGVLQLTTVSQVVHHAKALLDGAQEIVAFDIAPSIYDMLTVELRQVKERGLRLAGIVYREADASGDVALSIEAAVRPKRVPGQSIILEVDGLGLLIASLSEDASSVVNAIYSDSASLSSILHFTLISAIRLQRLRTAGQVSNREDEDFGWMSELEALPLGVKGLGSS